MDKLINTIQEIPKDKSVFVFDLDGTLAESKVNIDLEMAELLARLLAEHKVAIIGGASFEQMRSQLPDVISKNSNLFLLPLNGGSFYKYKDGDWHKLYSQSLMEEEKKKIFEAFEIVFRDMDYIRPAKIYGEVIEDRGGQVTFSALGQQASLEEKEKWAEENKDTRDKIISKLNSYLPDMETKVAGLTSIDITKKGIDKKFGIEQIEKHLGVKTEDILFFGDALETEGNDYPALSAGVVCYQVKSVEDTKEVVRYLLSN